MTNRKRKNTSGAVTAYVSRNKALKKLQIPLSDFRRICIWKGIYPQEPRHPKKVGLGSSAPKTYYFFKDIQFLMNEPLLAKFREFKVFVRKLKRATAKKESGAAQRLRRNKPKYKLDHIVKERYPSFIDALRDLDDCLSLCALFATLPKSRKVHVEQIDLCQRLVGEFMHYIIASNSLRKVFISIKGIYYQVEVEGQTITWIAPHKLAYEHPTDVDYRIMSSFVDFYTILLGFVNYRLYMKLGIVYPPKLVSLNQVLVQQINQDLSVQPDFFPLEEMGDAAAQEKRRQEFEEVERLQSLFKGLKFFLGREIPREAATFIIRSLGGQVSWDKSIDTGATYPESDETITHQIVDRPNVNKKYLSRYYIQPQWIFDCVNTRKLLPVADYFPDAILPPHLSPFVEEKDGEYIPPEKRRLLGLEQPAKVEATDDADNDSDGSENEEVVDDDDDDNDVSAEDVDKDSDVEPSDDDVEHSDDDDDVEPSDDDDNVEPSDGDDDKQAKKRPRLSETPDSKNKKSANDEKKVHVSQILAGQVQKVDASKVKKKEQDEEKKLSEMMIPKKHRRLYRKIQHLKKKQNQEAQTLTKKRETIEKSQKKKSKKMTN